MLQRNGTFKISLRHLFCVTCNFFRWLLAQVLHAWQAYKRIGWKMLLYINSLFLMLSFERLLIKKYKFWYSFFFTIMIEFWIIYKWIGIDETNKIHAKNDLLGFIKMVKWVAFIYIDSCWWCRYQPQIGLKYLICF